MIPLSIAAFILGAIGWRAMHDRLSTSSSLDRLVGLVWGMACLSAGIAGVAPVALSSALVVGLVVSFLSPVSALTFLVGLLIVRPWEMTGGENFGFLPRLFALLTLVRVGLHCVTQPSSGIFVGRSTVWFVLLIGWFFLATVCAAGPTYLGTVELGNFIPLTILFLLIPTVALESKNSESIGGALVLAVVGAVGAAYFSPPIPLPGEPDFNRLTGRGLFGNSNDLAALIVIALSLLVVPAFRASQRALSLSFWAQVAVLLVGLWRTQSRGAVIALGLAGLILAVTGRQRKWSPILIPLVVVGIGLFFTLVKRDAADLETSKASRWSYAIAGARMAKSHPLFGVGMENYPRLYERYTPAFDEWGERTAHSSWVLVLAETGIPGLLLFVAFYGSALRSAGRMRGRAPEYLVMVLGYGIAMSFLSHTYTLLPYLVTALTVGAERALRRDAITARSLSATVSKGELCFSK